jgi:hypothetical protein
VVPVDGGDPGPHWLVLTLPLNGPATASGATPLLALTEKLYDCPEELGAPYNSPFAGSRCIPAGNAPDETEYVGTG